MQWWERRATYLGRDPYGAGGGRDVEAPGDGDLGEAALEGVWPECEPGHGPQRQLTREAEDDGAVAVAAQRGEAAVLIRDPAHTTLSRASNEG